MNDLSVWAETVRRTTREAFMREYAHPFLLIKTDDQAPVAAPPPPVVAQTSDDDWSSSSNQTQISKILPKTGSFAVLRHNAVSYRVLALVSKAPLPPLHLDEHGQLLEEPEPIVIALGRSEENDIVLTSSSISKRHAKITIGRGKHKGELVLTDSGSRNGTSVKGRKLAPLQATPIDFGDAIVLGDLAVSLIGAGALWEIIRTQQG